MRKGLGWTWLQTQFIFRSFSSQYLLSFGWLSVCLSYCSLRQDFVKLRLTSKWLCSWRWPRTSDSPASTTQCWGYRHGPQCLVYTVLKMELRVPCMVRQAFYQLSYIPSPNSWPISYGVPNSTPTAHACTHIHTKGKTPPWSVCCVLR